MSIFTSFVQILAILFDYSLIIWTENINDEKMRDHKNESLAFFSHKSGSLFQIKSSR